MANHAITFTDKNAGRKVERWIKQAEEIIARRFPNGYGKYLNPRLRVELEDKAYGRVKLKFLAVVDEESHAVSLQFDSVEVLGKENVSVETALDDEGA